ncbi:hypothetical protein [Methylobacterium sp. 22177]|uniref:hypothetical protein n=1 Tax=Methylobacterium sp. 22177 TaxID=3453885 RepID=UPI003F836813
MFSSNWRQREQNGKDRLADEQEKRNDPKFKTREQQLRELSARQDALIQAEREQARIAADGPLQPVAELFREKFGGDLPEVVEVLSKPRGAEKLARILRGSVQEIITARRQAAEAARIEAGKAQIEIDGARRLATQEQAEAKRKAKAETAEAEA